MTALFDVSACQATWPGEIDFSVSIAGLHKMFTNTGSGQDIEQGFLEITLSTRSPAIEATVLKSLELAGLD
jgi:hypothetical protein